jgi:hypothetical protein
LGASLLLAGLMVFAYGYLTNCVPYESHDNGSYTYADYVGLFGGIFIFLGLAVLLFFRFASGLAGGRVSMEP